MSEATSVANMIKNAPAMPKIQMPNIVRMASPVLGFPVAKNPPLSVAVQRDTVAHMKIPRMNEYTTTTAAEILTAVIHKRGFSPKNLFKPWGLAVLTVLAVLRPFHAGCAVPATGGGTAGFWKFSGGKYGFGAGWGGTPYGPGHDD